MADLDCNKQTVIAFITRAFNDKQPADAVAKYVGSQYIQHDPQSPDGAEAFVQFVNGTKPSECSSIWRFLIRSAHPSCL